MSLIKNYGNGIALYDYTEKSILLVTPTEWGRKNAEQLKTISKFGTNFKIEGNPTPGWIMAKKQQEQNIKKIEGLLDGTIEVTTEPIRKMEKDSSDDEPRPARLMPKDPPRDIVNSLFTFQKAIKTEGVHTHKTPDSVIVYGKKDLVDKMVKAEYGSYSILFLAKWEEYKILELTESDE